MTDKLGQEAVCMLQAYNEYLGPRIRKGKVTLDADLLEVLDDERIVVLVEDRHLTVCSNTYTSLIPLEVGNRVGHIVYGFLGTISEVDGVHLTVDWDNGGQAVVALTDVERAE